MANTGAGLIDPGPIEFEAELLRSDSSGAACFVEFPFDLKSTYGKGNLVPIQAIFDGRVRYQGSIANMGGPCAMVLVRKDVLAQIGKDAGETVHVRVTLDTAIREIALPEDALAALEQSEAATTFWATLSYSKQREYFLWIDGAKRPETRANRIEQMVIMLAEGKRLK